MTMQHSLREGSTLIFETPWLARMIDKARLSGLGVIDEYDVTYPCPMDQRLLAQIGLEAEVFKGIVMTQQTDEAIVAELRQRQCLPV